MKEIMNPLWLPEYHLRLRHITQHPVPNATRKILVKNNKTVHEKNSGKFMEYIYGIYYSIEIRRMNTL